MTVLCEPLAPAAEHLAALLGEGTRVVASKEELAALLAGDPYELLVVFGPGLPPEEAIAFAAEYRLIRPATGVVLLRVEAEAGLLREALRAGVREVADPRDSAGVLDACGRSLQVSRHLAQQAQQIVGTPAGAARPETDGRPVEGQVVTVLGAKGGAGKTTIATNLAVALAAAQRSVLLIDLDLQFGDVAIALQLNPSRNIADAVSMADRLDETGLRSLLTPAGPGLETLLAPTRPTDAENVGAPLVAEVLRLAKQMFDHVVVDSPAQFTDPLLAALDVTDRCLIVAAPDVLTLKNSRISLETLDLLGLPQERRVVVLNRAGSPVGLTLKDAERVLRMPVGVQVPSSADVPSSLNRGVPIAAHDPGHAVSKAIGELLPGALGVTMPQRERRPGRRRARRAGK